MHIESLQPNAASLAEQLIYRGEVALTLGQECAPGRPHGLYNKKMHGADCHWHL